VVEYVDKTLSCVDCGAEFTFSITEQEYHASRGFTNEPKRCLDCRQARKAQRGDSSTGPRRQMYQVTCAECGKETQVPFEPRNGRPVYCFDCYSKRSPAQMR
jgi:CxxC-x17-CxxC domain-containing protein